MYRYKKILVDLTLTDEDAAILHYAALVSHMAHSEEIYFAHVTDTLDLTEALRQRYPELLRPMGDYVQTDMKKRVQAHFDGYPETNIQYRVSEGAPLYELLRLARLNDIDLLIVSSDAGRIGGLSEKLARKAPCSVLIVPPTAQPEITSVLVPIDFSSHATDAMDVGLAFASAADVDKIHALHAYGIPSGYYKSGKTADEFQEIIEKYGWEKYNDLIAHVDMRGVGADVHFVIEENPHTAIQTAMSLLKTDLVVMGARGRTTGAAVLLGSVTERILRSTSVPMIAVKKKGANLSFLDALLHL